MVNTVDYCLQKINNQAAISIKKAKELRDLADDFNEGKEF